MKYSLHINQSKAIELGITHINQAHIFDFLTTAGVWAGVEMIDNEVYYQVSRKFISQQLPLLKINQDTVYRHLKFLAKISLIDYKIIHKKDYIKITEWGKKYLIRGEETLTGQDLEETADLNPSFLEGSKPLKGKETKDFCPKTGQKKLGFKSEFCEKSDFPYNIRKDIINKKKKYKKEKKEDYFSKCDNFSFDEKLNQKIIKRFPNITSEKITILLETFQSMAINRASPFKNLTMGFINYLNQGYLDACIKTNSPASGTVQAFEQGVGLDIHKIKQIRKDNPNITDAEIEAMLNQQEPNEAIC